MKKNYKLLAGVAVIGLGTLFISGQASAHVNGQNGKQDATRTAIETALSNNDYAAFKTAVSAKQKPLGSPEITEAVFAKMVQANTLRKSGDTVGAEKIMSELGFKKREGQIGRGMKIDQTNFTDAQKTAFAQAETLFKAGNKDEARKILNAAGIKKPERAIPENLTDAQKVAWQNAKTLFDAGKKDEAKKILADAGIKPPEKRHHKNLSN